MAKLFRDALIAGALIYGTGYFAPPMVLFVFLAVGLIYLILACLNGGRSAAALVLAVGAWPVLDWFETGRCSWQTFVAPALLAILAAIQLSGLLPTNRRAPTDTDDHLERIAASHIAELELNRRTPEN